LISCIPHWHAFQLWNYTAGQPRSAQLSSIIRWQLFILNYAFPTQLQSTDITGKLLTTFVRFSSYLSSASRSYTNLLYWQTNMCIEQPSGRVNDLVSQLLWVTPDRFL
jgi:hypothetical protein